MMLQKGATPSRPFEASFFIYVYELPSFLLEEDEHM